MLLSTAEIAAPVAIIVIFGDMLAATIGVIVVIGTAVRSTIVVIVIVVAVVAAIANDVTLPR